MKSLAILVALLAFGGCAPAGSADPEARPTPSEAELRRDLRELMLVPLGESDPTSRCLDRPERQVCCG